MAAVFFKTIDGEQVAINLFSLEEYESTGGIYNDAGNGGEDMSAHKHEFLCAATVSYNETGLSDNDILEECGLTYDDYWYDSAAGVFLLYRWPADAPLDVRCNVATAPARETLLVRKNPEAVIGRKWDDETQALDWEGCWPLVDERGVIERIVYGDEGMPDGLVFDEINDCYKHRPDER